MISGHGPRTVGIESRVVMILTVTCTDPARGSFIDVHRPAQPEGRRQELGPGETFRCRVAAGQADITFGDATEFRFDPDQGGDE